VPLKYATQHSTQTHPKTVTAIMETRIKTNKMDEASSYTGKSY